MPPVKRRSTAGSSASTSPTTPGLRRAPTFTLESDSSSSASVKRGASLSRKSSTKISLKSVPSLTKKATIVREGSGICSSVIGLDSGSSVGKTASITSASVGDGCDVIKVTPSVVSRCGSKAAAAAETLRKSLSEVADLIKTTSMSKTPSVRKSPSISKTPSLTKTPSVKSTSGADDSVTAPPLPPGGLLEIVFSFDTTGSMYSSLAEVRGRIKDMVQRLQADIPGIRIAVMAHGDYCDKDLYIVKWIDFGASIPELCDFVENVAPTSGGDGDECYELVLRRTHEVLSWTPGSQRSLVMIGDASPHEVGYRYEDFTNDINWRVEAATLRDMGVRIYCVGAHGAENLAFYKTIADITKGRVLPLNKFNVLFDMLMSICYREGGADLFDAYESEVRARHGGAALDGSLEGLFKTLKDGGSVGSPTKATKIIKAKKMKGILPKGAKAKTAELKVKSAKKAKGTDKGKTKQKRQPKKKTAVKSRESLTDRRFETGPLKRLKWSRWMLGLTPLRPTSVTKETGPVLKWGCQRWTSGYFNKAIFTTDDKDVPAVYEFAVRLSTKRKYPIYWKMTSGISGTKTWVAYLLSQKTVRHAINQIILKGGRVMIRRGTFKTRRTPFMCRVAKYISRTYDYAWIRSHTRKTKFRNLKMAGVVISSDKF